MRRLRLSAMNWTYVFGEILLIFIGITIAIWFNNWNEARRALALEVKTLEELRDAIQQDLVDVEINLASYEKRRILYRALIFELNGTQPMSDSLHQMLPFIQGYTFFLSNIGPFETLKSRGMGTITNDSLRIKIANYYDLDYEAVQIADRSHFEHYRDYLKPLLLKYFDLWDFPFGPFDFADFQSNRFEMVQVLSWALRNDQYTESRYASLREKAIDIVAHLDREIAILTE